MQNTNTIKKSALAPTIIIAGGAGFIGSHLAEVLLQKEARVIVLDNFKTGKEIHVKHLLANPKFALFDVDINYGLPSEIESADYILHLAGLEEYLYSKEEIDLDSLLTNALGTKNLLDLANRSSAKLLLASTIDVYEGKMSQLSLESYFGKTGVEEMKYSIAEAKRYAEALVWEYHKKYATDVRIVRLPEVFGPRMSLDASGQLGKMLKDLIEGRPFTIKGDGTKKEHYLYITDAVAGMIKALLGENTCGSIYTLVPKEPITTLEIAYLVRGLADRKVEINFQDNKNLSDPRTFTPDTYNHIYIKWDPKVALKDGIVMTLNWFGYKINENSFKNAKLIDEKTKEKTQGLIAKMTTSSPDPIDAIYHQSQLNSSPQYTSVDLPSYVAPSLENQPNVVPVSQVQEFQQSYNERKDLGASDIPKIKKHSKVQFKFTPPKINIKLPNIGLKKDNTEAKSIKIGVFGRVSAFLIVLFSFLAVFVVLPGYKTYTLSKKAMADLLEVPDLMSNFETEIAIEKSSSAYKSFAKAGDYYASLDWLFKLVGKGEEYKATARLLHSVTYFSKTAQSMVLSADPLIDIWTTLKPGSTKTFDPNNLEVSKTHISEAKNSLQIAIADYDEVNPSLIPDSFSEHLNIYEAVIKDSVQGLDFAASVISDLPRLLGYEKEMRYIILFQNNNELRPTGGFIGSYATLIINDGRITELNIDDIYNPDGQLELRNIGISPPKPIGDFLSEDRLFIRNANWDPDFPRSAEIMKDLFYRLSGEEVAGMVTVDLNLVSRLLDVTGPVFLTAYNEEIGSNNLYERTQHHASYNFEEGSQQKRQFLTVLGSKLIESLFSQETAKSQDLFSAFVSALNERHMQVHLFSSSLNAFLEKEGWTGSLLHTSGDYLQVVNANLGGTKSNYYVNQDMTYRVSSKTRDGLLRAELTLDYDHTGVDESWPGGPYTNYVRVLSQSGSKLTGAKIIRNKSIEEDIMQDMIISSVEPYTSFETSFVLDPQNSVRLVLYYDLAQELSVTKSNTDYSLVWQKQSGTHNDNYTYSFSLPFGMNYVDGSDNLRVAEGTLISSGKMNEDLLLQVMLE